MLSAATPFPPSRRLPDDPPSKLAAAMQLRSWLETSLVDEETIHRASLGNFSEQRSMQLRDFQMQKLKELDGWNFKELGVDGRIDWILARKRIQTEILEMDRESVLRKEMLPWVPFASGLTRLLQDQRDMVRIDPRVAADLLNEAARLVGQIHRALDKSRKNEPSAPFAALERPEKVVAVRVAQSVERLEQEIQRWWRFYSGYDPEMMWWAKEPLERCTQALRDYHSFLRRECIGAANGEDAPLVGNPIGRKGLLDALAAEFIVYSPEELMALAEKELQFCRREQAKASQELGFGDDWRKALDHVSKLHAKPGDQPQLIRQLALEAIDFVESRDLVTVPQLCKDSWRMEMMSAERQKVNPYFTGGEVISVSFPTDDMSQEDKLMSLRGNNLHFCRATVHHELIPGHHLQTFMSQRHRAYREPFRTPFLVEGWALYWEMLLWDLGFAHSPEDRVGMLFWRTHRCARILFSLKFHLGEMTPEQAIEFLVTTVGHERRNATAEVRRSIAGGYSPLYQAAYMVGGLQLKALRKEMVEGAGMTHREFHDAVLRENAIPIELIRASLQRQLLPKDFEARWRFYPLP